MKKKYEYIFWTMTALSLIMYRNNPIIPGAAITLIIATFCLIVGYIIKGYKIVKIQEIFFEVKLIMAVSYFYFSFSIIGIVLRQLWFCHSPWRLIYHDFFWPVWTIGIFVYQISILLENYKTNNMDVYKKIKNSILIPMVVVIIFGTSSFYTSMETFCKIYKSYTADEWYKKHDSAKQ